MTSTKTAITEYDIECTWDHAQYWQGAGLAFTDFDDLATGVGATPSEAYADALDQLAMNTDYDVDTIEWDGANDVTEGGCECAEDDYAACEHYWYVTVRVR